MSELKQLNLTEHDFDLLVEGLDALPERGLAGEMMGDLFGAIAGCCSPMVGNVEALASVAAS